MAKANISGWGIFGLIALLAGGVVTAVWLATKSKGDGSNPLDVITGGTGGNTGGGNSGGGNGTGGVFDTGLNMSKVLENGVRGAEVKELQRILNKLDIYSPLVEDGIFGPKTQAALQKQSGKTSITLSEAKIKWYYL